MRRAGQRHGPSAALVGSHGNLIACPGNNLTSKGQWLIATIADGVVGGEQRSEIEFNESPRRMTYG
jgi:hypothetical protein